MPLYTNRHKRTGWIGTFYLITIDQTWRWRKNSNNQNNEFRRHFVSWKDPSLMTSNIRTQKSHSWSLLNKWRSLQSINQKMLSVFMTVYKRSEFTDQTIKSLLKKTNNQIELVIWIDWNDFETNEKADFLQKIRQKQDWKLIIFKEQTDKWIVDLRNKSFEICSNNNIFIVNDDIEIFSDKYDEKIEQLLIENEFVNPVFVAWRRCFDFNKIRKINPDNISWHARATRKDVRKKIWPIDNRLKLRFSDDRIFQKIKEQKIKSIWTDEIKIKHFWSMTLNDPEWKQRVDRIIKQDQYSRIHILIEHGRSDKRFDLLLQQIQNENKQAPQNSEVKELNEWSGQH